MDYIDWLVSRFNFKGWFIMTYTKFDSSYKPNTQEKKLCLSLEVVSQNTW